MNLLKNSIEIKTSKYENSIDKVKAVILIQIKIMVKYENLITLITSEIWGKEERNLRCRQSVSECIEMVENIIKEGIRKGEIIEQDTNAISSIIFGLTSSGLMYKLKNKENINIQDLFNEYSRIIIKSLKK